MKYLHIETATENVKQLFSQTQNDTISLQEAFIAWGRDLKKEEVNRAWLSNKLTHLKYHNLVKPVYHRRNSRRVLEAIQLTLEGKKLLGRVNDSTNTSALQINGARREIIEDKNTSLGQVMRMVTDLRKGNPEFEITFDVKLKELKA